MKTHEIAREILAGILILFLVPASIFVISSFFAIMATGN